MRKLTIKRKKSFVACLGTIKVYVEDAENNELTIAGTPCKKLGILKNGEEKTFEVSENSVKVYTIVDKVSKDYCNDCYLLEEGSDDVYLVGQNKLNPALGNPFRFENNNSDVAQMNYKKSSKSGTKIFVGVLIFSIIIGFIIGLML